MQTEKEITDSMIVLLKKIGGIIKTEISEIEGKIESSKQKEDDPIDEEIRITILYVQKSYLDFYKKIFDFLCSRLISDHKDSDFFFYLPLLRTLIEIYAYLLYLSFQDENKQMTLVSINILNEIANLDVKKHT